MLIRSERRYKKKKKKLTHRKVRQQAVGCRHSEAISKQYRAAAVSHPGGVCIEYRIFHPAGLNPCKKSYFIPRFYHVHHYGVAH